MNHVAIDLGGKESQICIRQPDGTIVEERKVPIPLVVVAHRAREPEVLPEGWPAQRLGDDVIDLHRRADDARRGQAVTAAVTCVGGDLLSKS